MTFGKNPMCDDYIECYLPNTFKPLFGKHVTRVGPDTDGGYFLDTMDLLESNVLISLGVGIDWSFEEEFKKRNNEVSIISFDASTGLMEILKRLLKAIVKLQSFTVMYLLVKKIFDYRNFWKLDNCKHIKYFVGDVNQVDTISLGSIFQKYGGSKNFLKIDIEGNEYRVLNEILDNQHNITSLVIEFHDVDLHLEKIINFINSFESKIISLNINNSGFITKNKTPTVIELTFSKRYEEISEDKVSTHISLKNDANKKAIKTFFYD